MARFIFYDPPPEVGEEIARLRWQMSRDRVLLAAYRIEALFAKANFNPNEARVPGGNSRESGRWTRVGGGARTPSNGPGRTSQPRATRVADGSDPLKARSGKGPAAQVSGALNEIVSGRSTSVSKVIGTGAGSATIRINKQQGDRVTVDASTIVGSLHATGTMSPSPDGIVISNLTLTAPGILNPLRIVSAPTQAKIFDAPDGSLRIKIDKRLIIGAPIGGQVDLSPDQTIVVPEH